MVAEECAVTLMFQQLEREMELTQRDDVRQAIQSTMALMQAAQAGSYEARIQLLKNTLGGISTNSTACGACQMAVGLAKEALRRDEEILRTDK